MPTEIKAITIAGMDSRRPPTVGNHTLAGNGSVPLVEAMPSRDHGPMIR